MLILVLGGARSGKSRYAEQCALESGKRVIYIATATAGDPEMQTRIEKHQSDRPNQWQTIEEPVFLAKVLRSAANEQHFLLVDCLTLWLSNIMFDRQGNFQEQLFASETQGLLVTLSELSGHVVLVSNEVGQGVVPVKKMVRHFVDEAGRLHQNLARICDRVILMTAGLPQRLK